jgi:hypothetical protein
VEKSLPFPNRFLDLIGAVLFIVLIAGCAPGPEPTSAVLAIATASGDHQSATDSSVTGNDHPQKSDARAVTSTSVPNPGTLPMVATQLIPRSTQLPSTILTATPTPPMPTQAVPVPSLAPPPTLAPPATDSFAKEMLLTNGGCELPCWWGIEPGKTDWATVENRISYYGGRVFDIPYAATVFDYRIRQAFDHQDGKVRSIRAIGEVPGGKTNDTLSADWRRFSLERILSDYGKPTQVLLDLSNYCADRCPALTEYGMYVLYDQLGILIRYFGSAPRGDPILVCPIFAQVNYIELWLQSPQDSDPLLERMHLDPDELKGLRPLGETTGMSIDTFYETFKDSSSKACVSSPAKFWP